VAKTLGSARQVALVGLLIAARERAGLTQTDLATRLGEYQSFVARLESGQRRIDVVELIEIASILGIDAADVVKAVAAVRAPPLDEPRG
jgi:transcriptional regulator with XRE-family HTH domain